LRRLNCSHELNLFLERPLLQLIAVSFVKILDLAANAKGLKSDSVHVLQLA
jgi:hypothetical protein